MINFLKMNGLGNDFVVVDARKSAFQPTVEQVVEIADRRKGVGCDQLIVMENSQKADVFMRIFNADGSEVSACGNASRCVAELLMEEKKQKEVVVETRSGFLPCVDAGNWLVTANMGVAHTDWRDIPLAREENTLSLPVGEGELQNPVGVSMGNPHAVFFVKDADAVPLEKLGPKLEHNPLFPERANIGVAEVLSKSHIKLRVWERGTGETLACGTGACAAAVAGCRRNLLLRDKITVSLPGGDLLIEWMASGEVMMTGPVEINFRGSIDD